MNFTGYSYAMRLQPKGCEVMMELSWKKIEIEDKTEIIRFLSMGQSLVSDYNFTHLMIWQEAYRLEFACIDSCLVIRGLDIQTGKPYIYMPLGQRDIDHVIHALIRVYRDQGEWLQIKAITESMVPQLMTIQAVQKDLYFERNDYEYVYRVDKLAHYSESSLRRKREMCRYFESRYSYEFLPYATEDYERLMPLLQRWYQEADVEEDLILSAEWKGIRNILENFEAFDCQGYMVVVQGMVIGFIIAEPLNSTSLVVHFEKGDRQYKGVYDIMIRDLCRLYAHTYETINLEEDMGLAGLRMAKSLYKPDDMVKKGLIIYRTMDI